MGKTIHDFMPPNSETKTTTNHWIPVGVGVGTAMGVVMKDMGTGISIGLILGSAISLFVERKRKKETSPL
ncbi:MAG: hypothetical protein Q8J74_04450, partial [Candidatus Didemnitutus sp.]|nr:hypothetical protein [Candidatus Didemnitutus sp.]